MSVRVIAIVCARNETLHIEACIDSFVREGIEVVLIDHSSEDGTRRLAERFLGAGLLAIETLAWDGHFALAEQLVHDRIAGQSNCDWLIHADADEWLQAPAPFASLRLGIEAVARQGYNCINFDEFVFVPRGDENYENTTYREKIGAYYFFQPQPQRLMRCWDRRAGLRNTASGGHLLAGDALRLYPRAFILRHYIALSAAHAQRKYQTRLFAADEVARGWHHNRLNIPAQNLRVRDMPWIKDLAAPILTQLRHLRTDVAAFLGVAGHRTVDSESSV